MRLTTLVVPLLLAMSSSACVSWRSRTARDHNGWPLSTWAAHERLDCSRFDRPAQVAPDSLSDRQRRLAVECGQRRVARRARTATEPPPVHPPVPPRPTRPPAVASTQPALDRLVR